MRILLINYEYPPYGGGAGNATFYIATELVQKNHEVDVLTGGPLATSVENGVSIYRVGSRRANSYSSSVFEMADFLFRAGIFLFKNKKIRWDISIAFFVVPSGILAWRLKQAKDTKFLVALRGGDVPGCEPGIDWLHFLLRPIRRKIYAAADAVFANSRELAALAMEADPVRVSVIPNGIDCDVFRSVDNRKEKSLLGPIKLVFAGRIQRQKDLPSLIKMLAHAKKYGIDFRLDIVGDGPERGAAVKIATESGIADEITWSGWASKAKLRGILESADWLLNLSSYEGHPNIVLEAMAMKTPIIASDIGPHRDLIQEGVTGFLIRKDDEDALLQCLKKISLDPSMTLRFGHAARNLVKHQYSWGKTVSEITSLVRTHN